MTGGLSARGKGDFVGGLLRGGRAICRSLFEIVGKEAQHLFAGVLVVSARVVGDVGEEFGGKGEFGFDEILQERRVGGENWVGGADDEDDANAIRERRERGGGELGGQRAFGIAAIRERPRPGAGRGETIKYFRTKRTEPPPPIEKPKIARASRFGCVRRSRSISGSSSWMIIVSTICFESGWSR